MRETILIVNSYHSHFYASKSYKIEENETCKFHNSILKN